MSFWLINIVIFILYFIVLKIFHKEKIFLIISFLHFAGIAALRGIYVGTDTYYYTVACEYLHRHGYVYHHAMSSSPVFIFYMKLIYSLWNIPNMYILATAIPTNAIVFFLIYKYSKNYFSSVYLYLGFYLYFFSMNAARQMLAVSVTLLAYHMFQQHKKLISVLFFVLACGIHSSALLFGGYYVVSFIRWSGTKIVLFLLTSLFAGSNILFFSDFFVKLFPNYRYMFEKGILNYYNSQGRTAAVIACYCIFTVLLSIYFRLQSSNRFRFTYGQKTLLCAGDITERQEKQTMEWTILLLTAAVVEILFPNVIVFTRAIYVLFIYIIFLLPNTLERIREYRMLIKFLTLAPIFFFMILQLMNNYSGVLNYKAYYG